MIKLLKLFLCSALTLATCAVSAEEKSADKPLEIGVVPYLSARLTISRFEPLRLYLEQTLGKPVKLYTANSFKSFLLQAQGGDYDLVINASHFARILQKENNFIPLLRVLPDSRALLMSAVSGPVTTNEDLRGQIIAVPDKLALATIIVLTELREKGLKEGSDFRLMLVPSFASAILAVQKGDASAAITSQAILQKMPQEQQDSVKPLLDAGKLSRLIFLAHPRLGKAESLKISNAVLKFSRDTEEGKKFTEDLGFENIIPITSKEMNRLDRYIPETKRLLAETP